MSELKIAVRLFKQQSKLPWNPDKLLLVLGEFGYCALLTLLSMLDEGEAIPDIFAPQPVFFEEGGIITVIPLKVVLCQVLYLIHSARADLNNQNIQALLKCTEILEQISGE